MYERIVVIGSSGSGKSTLARKLGPSLKLNVIHLDWQFWNPHWKEKPRHIRIQIMERLARKKRWIIEGSYLNSSDCRLKAADTIIFLDLPVYLCLWSVIKRYLQYKWSLQSEKKRRNDLPSGCPERLSLSYILKVLVYPVRGRRLFFERLQEIDQKEKDEAGLPKITIHIFKSRKEVDAFLLRLPAILQEAQSGKESSPVQNVATSQAGRSLHSSRMQAIFARRARPENATMNQAVPALVV